MASSTSDRRNPVLPQGAEIATGANGLHKVILRDLRGFSAEVLFLSLHLILILDSSWVALFQERMFIGSVFPWIFVHSSNFFGGFSFDLLCSLILDDV